ncbi:WD repeat-containing protein 74 [Chytridiales sp. JEL 0842]|nr:WD repeat-containing protein 74 [Chytridiales sp. JEL 0842]
MPATLAEPLLEVPLINPPETEEEEPIMLTFQNVVPDVDESGEVEEDDMDPRMDLGEKTSKDFDMRYVVSGETDMESEEEYEIVYGDSSESGSEMGEREGDHEVWELLTTIVCTSFGNISYVPPLSSPSPDSIQTFNSDSANEEPIYPLPAFPTTSLDQSELNVMRPLPGNPLYFATGGEERDLNIWKVERVKPLLSEDEEETTEEKGQPTIHWKAKNVKNDHLDLRVPVSIVDLQFIQPEGREVTKVVTVSRHRWFRVYDLHGEGRRPALTVKIGEHPMRCLTLSEDGTEAIIADTTGQLTHHSTLTGARLGAYKSHTGTITSLLALPSTPTSPSVVCTVSLDRFLRIYQKDGERRLISKVYLKQRMYALAYDDAYTQQLESGKGDEEEEEDKIWEGMEAVGDSGDVKKKKKKVVGKKKVDGGEKRKRSADGEGEVKTKKKKKAAKKIGFTVTDN